MYCKGKGVYTVTGMIVKNGTNSGIEGQTGF